MIHVCSLARLHDTVEETGARHIVTLLRTDRPGAAAARPSRRSNHLMLGMDDIAAPMDGYIHPARGACRTADRVRARLGPRGADGGALLRRHQPLDRRRLCRRLRAQSAARRAGDRAGESARASRDRAAQYRASSRSPTALLGRDGRMVARDRDDRPRPCRRRRRTVPARSRLSRAHRPAPAWFSLSALRAVSMGRDQAAGGVRHG